jgi:hypothetical protein
MTEFEREIKIKQLSKNKRGGSANVKNVICRLNLNLVRR